MKKIVYYGLLMFSILIMTSCKVNSYKVKIIVNDDSNTIINEEVKHGNYATKPNEEFIKEKYEFDYWQNEETGEKFSFDQQITSNITIIGVWKSDGIRRGTFDRQYPSYYKTGIPLVDDSHVVYINFDGFARYYYDEALKRNPNNLPNLRKIQNEGVFFEDFRTTTPSITNPSQNMIISGATTKETQNVYRYYDRNTNYVVQQERENNSDTIIDKAIEANMSVASVLFYLTETKLTTSDPNKLYVTNDNTNPKVIERGSEKFGDHFSRFEQAIKLVKGEKIKTGGNEVTVSNLPKLMIIYADDLDTFGHNDKETVYGRKMSLSESERLDKVVSALIEMDQKLGEFIQATKDANVYDDITFVLSTDHGMTPFGAISGDEGGKYANSKIADLRYAIEQFDKKYQLEKVEPNNKPNSRTTVVGVGMNLNLQLTFKNGISDSELEELKEHLLKEEYVGVVKTRKELEEEGYWTFAADMIVSPSERYNFAPNVLSQYRVRGQHDSFLESSNKIFGVVWGKGIKKGVVYNEKAYNYDLGITMAAILGLDLPKANGIVLDIFEKKN